MNKLTYGDKYQDTAKYRINVIKEMIHQDLDDYFKSRFDFLLSIEPNVKTCEDSPLYRIDIKVNLASGSFSIESVIMQIRVITDSYNIINNFTSIQALREKRFTTNVIIPERIKELSSEGKAKKAREKTHQREIREAQEFLKANPNGSIEYTCECGEVHTGDPDWLGDNSCYNCGEKINFDDIEYVEG